MRRQAFLLVRFQIDDELNQGRNNIIWKRSQQRESPDGSMTTAGRIT